LAGPRGFHTAALNPPEFSQSDLQEGQRREVLEAFYSARNDSVVIVVAIVVVVIPIVIRMPAMLVLIPPSMTGGPAALPRFVELVARAIGLLTLVAVVLDGFVQLVIGFRNASLAIVVIGPHLRRAGEHKKTSQCCCSKCHLSEEQTV
jgi:hypothetical protein